MTNPKPMNPSKQIFSPENFAQLAEALKLYVPGTNSLLPEDAAAIAQKLFDAWILHTITQKTKEIDGPR